MAGVDILYSGLTITRHKADFKKLRNAWLITNYYPALGP
jgi:hypothetical protein